MKTGLVVTAHPGDFVWRAGGAVALHAKKGYRVKIVCLSYGERGESQFGLVRAPRPETLQELPVCQPRHRPGTEQRVERAGQDLVLPVDRLAP